MMSLQYSPDAAAAAAGAFMVKLMQVYCPHQPAPSECLVMHMRSTVSKLSCYIPCTVIVYRTRGERA